MSIPECLPVLSAGAHKSPAEGACVMEYVSLLAGEEWSDSPACTHPVLATAARTVNDRMSDDERPALVPLIGRLFGTAPTGADVEQKRLAVSLAVWCARRVLPADAHPASVAAVEAAEGWLAGHVSEQECRAAATTYATYAGYAGYAATYATYAGYAGYAAANAANAAAHATCAAAGAANAAAHATYAAHADGSRVAAWLTGLLDEYDRLTGRTEHCTVTPTDLAALIAATA